MEISVWVVIAVSLVLWFVAKSIRNRKGTKRREDEYARTREKDRLKREKQRREAKEFVRTNKHEIRLSSEHCICLPCRYNSEDEIKEPSVDKNFYYVISKSYDEYEDDYISHTIVGKFSTETKAKAFVKKREELQNKYKKTV